MSDHIEPSTHIDVKVIRNLLISRLNEGKDMMKLSTVSAQWKRTERAFQEKCAKAVALINEAIQIKEGKRHEIPGQNQTPKQTSENLRPDGIKAEAGKT